MDNEMDLINKNSGHYVSLRSNKQKIDNILVCIDIS